MQLAKNITQSFVYRIGFGVGSFIVLLANAFQAGFEAAERRYAKIP